MAQRPESQRKDGKQPKLWKCGDPYRYPLPKPDGDCWEILLQPYLKKDNAQCNAWRDEIQYLLIFAGLFSVVISIFVLHSAQSLQLNSNDVSANMLAIIASSLNNMAVNGSIAGDATPANVTSAALLFHASRSHVRISILWFISLVLSLATLIVGIVILQWIREHQRYTEDVSSKEAVAVYHMRLEAWKKWHVPQIISGLPLLLLIAVILFFAGIIVYLFTLNRTLAIAVTIVIGLTLLFLIITTLLPTLQCFILTLSEPSRKKAIPTQCPYKSPQSWIFYRAFGWIFKYTFSLGWNLRYFPIAFFVQRNRYSWMMFDSWWLTLRSTYSQFIHGVFTPSSDTIDLQSPGYDESQFLVQTMQKNSETSKTVLAAYYCFQEVSQLALKPQDDKELDDLNSSLRRRNQMLHMQYWNGEHYGKRTTASNHVDSSDVQKMHDENMMLFLWLPGSRTYSDPIARGLASHMLELQSRKLGYTMMQSSLEDACLADDREVLWMTRIYQQYKATDGTRTSAPWVQALHRRISKDVAEASVDQFVMIFDAFVRKYASEAGQAWTLDDLQVNVHGRTILQDFLAIPSIVKGHLFGTSESYAAAQFRSTLIFVATILETSWMHIERHERHDFLFFSITYFLSLLFPSGMKALQPGDPEIPIELLRSLSRYEETVDKAIWSAIFTGNYSIGDWQARLVIVETTKPIELHGSKKLVVESADTPQSPTLLVSGNGSITGQAAPSSDNRGLEESKLLVKASHSPQILIQFDSEDTKTLGYGQTATESQGQHVLSQSSQVRLDALNTQRSASQATQRPQSRENQNLLELSGPKSPDSRAGQAFQPEDVLTSEARDTQGFYSKEDSGIRSQVAVTPVSRDIQGFASQGQAQSVATSTLRDIQGFDSQRNGGQYQSDATSNLRDIQTFDSQGNQEQSQSITSSNSRDIQGFDSQKNGYFQSQDNQRSQSENIQRFDSQDNRNMESQNMQRFDSTSSQQFNSQNDGYFTSQDSQMLESQDVRIFDSQDSRNYQSQNTQRLDSTTSQQIESTDMQRFDSSSNQRFESNEVQNFDSNYSQRFQAQDNRFSSFTSSQYDSTERSWLQRAHYRGESWSSRVPMDQSLRSSQSVGDFDRDAVDGNLFY